MIFFFYVQYKESVPCCIPISNDEEEKKMFKVKKCSKEKAMWKSFIFLMNKPNYSVTCCMLREIHTYGDINILMSFSCYSVTYSFLKKIFFFYHRICNSMFQCSHLRLTLYGKLKFCFRLYFPEKV